MYTGTINNNTIFHSFLIKTTVRKRFLPVVLRFLFFESTGKIRELLIIIIAIYGLLNTIMVTI